LLDALAADVRLAFDAALLALAGRAGLQVTVLDELGDLAAWAAAFRTVQTAEAWRTHGDFVTAHPDALAPAVAARFRSGATVTRAEESAARSVIEDARATLARLVPAGTALALPAASSTAPPIDVDPDAMDAVRAATIRLTCIASLTGRPALVLPTMRVGRDPMGLCLVAAPGEDRALLPLAGVS
ncbi:MAG: amidase, Asp-tRNAAsn/Glu-tRNAGln amidotransferase subunit, partial [Pseudonocardiales bacterium]|nr:amidase, Asp-tRNAAsn/Glu-tRNAGln amidotransferase subunit [Pseudonocardiales bacterium]